ncbi:MAG TPA: DnaJ domain-containing protein, partial [Anaeromyxobacteraceae bacterium]|nr:DnaJ domain-containing protein [Anaeromyxobacteraceae bacterium]
MDRAAAYAILELPVEASEDQIRAAYRRRAFATHPDRVGGDAAAFHAVSEAYRSLIDPEAHRGHEPRPAADPATSSHVPPPDAARVLFEYLSDLASEMILNGATPEIVVAFLAREGCPESVAHALERDLRAHVAPAPVPAPDGRPTRAAAAPEAAAVAAASPAAPRAASASRRWPAIAAAAA